MSKRAPWPTMITGRLEPCASVRRAASTDSAGGAIARGLMRPSGPPAGALVGGLQGLHLVGEDQVRDAAVQDRALARQVHELGVLRGVQHGLTPLRDLAEGGGQIDLLEGAGPEHLGVDLAGQGEDRRAVDVGVPQAGQQVGRAGAGDRQAGGGAARELAVGRAGEGAAAPRDGCRSSSGGRPASWTRRASARPRLE